MDGTLSDVSHRKHFVEGDKKDWDSFYKNMGADKPRKDVIKHVREFIKDNEIEEVFVITSRREFARAETFEWINKNVPESISDIIGEVYMRGQEDMRPDIEVKKEIYNSVFKDKFDIVAVFEDRPRIIRMYQELGLNVIDVGGGVEF